MRDARMSEYSGETHPLLESVNGRVAIDLSDRHREGNAFRADLDAVLRVAATGDAFFRTQEIKAVIRQRLTNRMEIEEQGLSDGGRADERRFFIDLRAGFEATAAAHASGKRVAKLADMVVLGLAHA